MSNYVFMYYGDPQFSSPEEAQSNRTRWEAWANGLGDALVNRGIPLGTAKTISSTGTSDSSRGERLTGFSIVKADNLEAALEMVKSCPYLEQGTIDVAEAYMM